MFHKSIAAAICVLCITLTRLCGQSFEDRVFHDGLGNEMNYRVYLPEGHDAPDASFPVVVWLNGAGGVIGDRPQPLVDRLGQGQHSAFLIEPLSIGKWINCDGAALDNQDHIHCRQGLTDTTQLALGVLEEVESGYSVDTSRRVLAGYSEGGGGVFDVLRNRPGLFSAAVPLQSGNEARRFRQPVQTRVWSIHARDDTLLLPHFSSSVINSIAQQGGLPIYLEPSGGHAAPYMNAFFEDADDELYPWMFDGVEPPLAQLIYDPTNGRVVVDASTAPGCSIARFDLSAGRRNTFQPTIGDINGDPLAFSNRGVITYAASDGAGFGTTLNLGSVFPPGLGFTELHDIVTTATYDSPTATLQNRPFRIVLAPSQQSPDLPQTVIEEPWIVYSVNNLDRVNDLGLARTVTIGGGRDERAVAKFLLPELAENTRLEQATLRFYFERALGEPGAVDLWYSGDDNDFELVASTITDESYLATHFSIVSSSDESGRYYDVDVTELIQNDYLQDAAAAVSSFRLQLQNSNPGASNPGFLFAMPRDRGRFPHLALTYVAVPEPVSALMAAIGLCVIGGLCLRHDLRCKGGVN